MKVKLLAHSQLSEHFRELFDEEIDYKYLLGVFTDGQAVALTAIRTCYSPGKPSEIVANEGAKYFGNKATDGEGGTEAERLFRQIVRSKHLSTLEHLSFTFAVEGISRALLAQLTRHRVGFSFSVQSQRYVRFGSDDRSGGFGYVVPDKVAKDCTIHTPYDPIEEESCEVTVKDVFESAMKSAQEYYDTLRHFGVPAEDARAVLPQASACNLTMSVNLRSLLDFYSKRRKGNGAQKEITELAERLKDEVIAVEPWVAQFFEE